MSDKTCSKPKQPYSNGAIILRFITAVILIGAAYYLVFSYIAQLTFINVAKTTGILAGYCFIGFFVRPNPDTSDLGWCGGTMDNPFSMSDDANRALLALALVLGPGFFIVESIKLFYTYIIKK